ncbi:MAG: SRPBCC family protein [Flavobacteriales bacterium]
MSYSIKHLFHINAKRSDVFKAISTIEGLANWWTVQTTGSSAVGDVIQFRFDSAGGPDMKVTSVKENESATWECIASPHGWTGHTFTFALDENDSKTRVRFSHDGWKEQDDFHAICCFSWGRYMESLRQLCQTGKGESFGSPGYRK